jgi:hypothetical protein
VSSLRGGWESMNDEQKISNYLLGALPETEAERLDELSVANDEFAARMRVVENDLVDAYVKGELSGKTLKRFESHYLASPMRREKVRFAQAFLGFADKAAIAQVKDRKAAAGVRSEPEQVPSSGSFWQKFFRVQRLSLQWGLATAALLLLLAGGYFLFENARLRNQMTVAETERETLRQREQELQKQLADERSTDAAKATELERVRERLAQLEQQRVNQQSAKTATATNQPQTRTEAKDLHIVSLTLEPQMRGASQIPTVTVPPGTDYVAFQLELEANDFSAYRVALKNLASNQIIWQSGKLHASAKSKTIAVGLRAGLLKPQIYVLELSGLPISGTVETISSYTFKVETR